MRIPTQYISCSWVTSIWIHATRCLGQTLYLHVYLFVYPSGLRPDRAAIMQLYLLQCPPCITEHLIKFCMFCQSVLGDHPHDFSFWLLMNSDPRCQFLWFRVYFCLGQTPRRAFRGIPCTFRVPRIHFSSDVGIKDGLGAPLGHSLWSLLGYLLAL